MLFWRPFLEADGDDEIPKTRRFILTVDVGGGRTIASEKSIVELFASRQANLDNDIDNHQVRLTRTRYQSHIRKSPIQLTASTAAGRIGGPRLDHRVLDGAGGARFLSDLEALLEQPEEVLGGDSV